MSLNQKAGSPWVRRASPARAVLVAILACLGSAPIASAQEPSSSALPLTVRPSGFDPEPSEARERQERLLKRMQEDEFLFRNICVQCGGGVDKPGAYAPFEPAQALSGRPVPR